MSEKYCHLCGKTKDISEFMIKTKETKGLPPLGVASNGNEKIVDVMREVPQCEACRERRKREIKDTEADLKKRNHGPERLGPNPKW